MKPSTASPGGRVRMSCTAPRACQGRYRASRRAISPPNTVSLVVDLTLAAWALLELGVRIGERVHGKGARHRDRGTRILVVVALSVAIGTAIAAPLAQSPPASAPLPVSGLVLMWLGLALRVWS